MKKISQKKLNGRAFGKKTFSKTKEMTKSLHDLQLASLLNMLCTENITGGNYCNNGKEKSFE